MNPRAVVFDLGKVLVGFDYSVAARRFAARGNMSAVDIQAFIDHSPLLYQFETGVRTNQQFYQDVCNATGYRGEFDEFARIFADIFWPIEPMIQWQTSLRNQGVPTYIFSNTNELAVTHIRRSFPFYSNFDGYIYSYQQGAMKPSPKIYEAIERMAGRKGPEILYLDDRRENVEAGRARGWQVILHESPEQTFEIVRRLWPAWAS